jgi:hypothetical protein
MMIENLILCSPDPDSDLYKITIIIKLKTSFFIICLGYPRNVYKIKSASAIIVGHHQKLYSQWVEHGDGVELWGPTARRWV